MPENAEPEPVDERYATGSRKSRGWRLQGELHGDWEFYRLDGSLMRSGRFDRGRQVGVWRTFRRDGSLVKETGFGA
jgi:antitoxin component YwqK of YwqJK toxin-antitoxin module